jgi:hypothetical protein
MNVQNITAASATYQVIVNDFIAGKNETGQPSLVLDEDKFAPSHSLKRYITHVPNITVPAEQSKDVKVTITIPKDAAGGGYFGAVRFAPVDTNGQKKNVTISASVGSLLLIRVPGDIVENIKLESLDVRTAENATSANAFFTSNKGLYAVARFKNSGNVHEQPFGKIVLKKGTKTLQTTEINNTDPRGNALPDSIRRFSVKLDKVGFWGKYTIEGNFGYGSNGQLITGKSNFMVIPLPLIILALLLVVGIIGAIVVVPRAIKRYNANVLRKAGRR